MEKRILTEKQKAFIEDKRNIEVYRRDYMSYMGIVPTEDDLIDYMLEIYDEDSHSSVEEELIEEERLKNEATPTNPFLEKLDKFIGIVFIIWFFGSIFAAAAFSEKNEVLTFIILGQIFLGCGIFVLLKKASIGWLLVLIGGGIIGWNLLVMYPEIIPFGIELETLEMLLGGLFAFGLSLEVNIVSKIKFKRRCSVQVGANVINMVEDLYPVYEYEYNGKNYKVRVGENKKLSKGQHITIRINPEKPKEVYYKTGLSLISLVTLPFLFIGACLIIISVSDIMSKIF